MYFFFLKQPHVCFRIRLGSILQIKIPFQYPGMRMNNKSLQVMDILKCISPGKSKDCWHLHPAVFSLKSLQLWFLNLGANKWHFLILFPAQNSWEIDPGDKQMEIKTVISITGKGDCRPSLQNCVPKGLLTLHWNEHIFHPVFGSDGSRGSHEGRACWTAYHPQQNLLKFTLSSGYWIPKRILTPSQGWEGEWTETGGIPCWGVPQWWMLACWAAQFLAKQSYTL